MLLLLLFVQVRDWAVTQCNALHACISEVKVESWNILSRK